MGALFEIYESRLPEGLTDKKADNGSTKKAPSDNAAKSSGHIMLSYKWEHPSKPVMREFKKQLQNRGFKVWMDEDHMSKFIPSYLYEEDHWFQVCNSILNSVKL